jgi:hypothetical protein
MVTTFPLNPRINSFPDMAGQKPWGYRSGLLAQSDIPLTEVIRPLRQYLLV